MPQKIKDITGQRFGRLVVLHREGKRSGKPAWRARCDCGGEKVIRGTSLRGKNGARSCGCLQAERTVKANAKHRLCDSPEYKVWASLKARCAGGHPRYGGRGVKVCKRWQNSFAAFLADMGERPSPEHQVDRVDNDGDYTPNNCRWTTATENARSRSSTVFIEYQGRTHSIPEWAEILGIPRDRIYSRLARGWTEAERILLGTDHYNSKPAKLD